MSFRQWTAVMGLAAQVALVVWLVLRVASGGPGATVAEAAWVVVVSIAVMIVVNIVATIAFVIAASIAGRGGDHLARRGGTLRRRGGGGQRHLQRHGRAVAGLSDDAGQGAGGDDRQGAVT